MQDIKSLIFVLGKFIRRVWRYQMGNQNPYKKVQKDKQRSTKHYTCKLKIE